MKAHKLMKQLLKAVQLLAIAVIVLASKDLFLILPALILGATAHVEGFMEGEQHGDTEI